MMLRKEKRALCDNGWPAPAARMLRRYVTHQEPAKQRTDAGTRRREPAWYIVKGEKQKPLWLEQLHKEGGWWEMRTQKRGQPEKSQGRTQHKCQGGMGSEGFIEEVT